jgi:hypothetical protein
MHKISEVAAFVERVVGDLVFIAFDQLMNVFDRHAESAWVWDDEEVL